MHPFEAHADVGNPVQKGSVSYDSSKDEFTIVGAGDDMWAERDAFTYLYRKIKGDFIATARARWVGGNAADMYRKFGWIARESLTADSPHANASVHGDGHICLHWRRTHGGTTEEINNDYNGPDVVQLERRGTTFTMSTAKFGEPFVVDKVEDLVLPEELHLGLYVCAHSNELTETVVFDNVRITVPAPVHFKPYVDYIGSRLEVLDIATGHRETLLTVPHNIEAPNWNHKTNSLIYNSSGLLYNFDLATKQSTQIPTDFATKNNNDHLISPDGTQLGISHHSQDADGKSLIYVLPITGGTPTQVTPQGPSYLHGWSGNTLIYTAEREGNFDIYSTTVEPNHTYNPTTFTETRLTHTPPDSLEDGSEFSPSGDLIYFNSTRTGLMQIFTMQPDGSDQKQLTPKDDAFNNWFAHPSPDGKKIVIISYGQDVKARDHPYYKHVMLRVLDADGGNLRTVAYLYGGQGTINVPSWNKEGTKVAFVSHTGAL
ncbi:hypothetical protein HDV00_010918 [Rhizophlyctis rosea]|nr:hypothetical protein HDV00_010918 [Rhizophlyctis rosea]